MPASSYICPHMRTIYNIYARIWGLYPSICTSYADICTFFNISIIGGFWEKYKIVYIGYVSGIYIYIYIYLFWGAIYRSDNLLKNPPSRELLFSIYFRRRGLYRCIEPSIQKYIWFCPQLRAKSYIFQEIYMILPAVAGKKGYISYIWGLVGLNTAI